MRTQLVETATHDITLHGGGSSPSPAGTSAAWAANHRERVLENHVDVQRLLRLRPGAVVLDPGRYSSELDLSASVLAASPEVMVSAVRGIYRQLHQRLTQSEEEGVTFWRHGPPLGLVVFDLPGCVAGLASAGRRKSLQLMVDVLACMGGPMSIKVLQPAIASSVPAWWDDPRWDRVEQMVAW